MLSESWDPWYLLGSFYSSGVLRDRSCWFPAGPFFKQSFWLAQHQCKELAANSMCKCKFYSLDRVAVLPTWQWRSWTTAVNRLPSLLEFVNNWSDSGFPHFEGQVKQHWKPICSGYYCGAFVFLMFSFTWFYNEKHTCILSWWVTQRDTFFWHNTSSQHLSWEKFVIWEWQKMKKERCWQEGFHLSTSHSSTFQAETVKRNWLF